jgi:hypothetical protein
VPSDGQQTDAAVAVNAPPNVGDGIYYPPNTIKTDPPSDNPPVFYPPNTINPTPDPDPTPGPPVIHVPDIPSGLPPLKPITPPLGPVGQPVGPPIGYPGEPVGPIPKNPPTLPPDRPGEPGTEPLNTHTTNDPTNPIYFPDPPHGIDEPILRTLEPVVARADSILSLAARAGAQADDLRATVRASAGTLTAGGSGSSFGSSGELVNTAERWLDQLTGSSSKLAGYSQRLTAAANGYQTNEAELSRTFQDIGKALPPASALSFSAGTGVGAGTAVTSSGSGSRLQTALSGTVTPHAQTQTAGSAQPRTQLEAAVTTQAQSSDGFVPGTGCPPAPPANSDPRQVAGWWDGLSAAQQQQFETQFPDQIGSLDGIPCVARDKANRVILNEDEQQTTAELAQLKAIEPPRLRETGRIGTVPDTAWNQWNQQYSAVHDKLTGMQALQQRLSTDQPGGPAYLLKIDPTNLGKTIFAINNPDTSHNVATMVPGIHTKLSGGVVRQYITAGDNITQAAQAKGPGQTTSVIEYLNYDAPQSITGANTQKNADDAVGDLNNFLTGLSITHNPNDTMHSVLIGHSYGSTVVGDAASTPDGPKLDDVILLASPGAIARNASQLNAPADHVWTGLNQYDPIQISDGFDKLGPNPYDVSWGATQFNCDSPPEWPDAATHDSYWDRNSDSIGNIANIIDGQYGSVEKHYERPTAPPPIH